MSFSFTEQPHTDKINVWHNKIYLGEIFVVVQEREDIDWDVYRADKTLRMSVNERFITKYIPTIKIGGHMPSNLSPRLSKEEAAQAMLDVHRAKFNAD